MNTTNKLIYVITIFILCISIYSNRLYSQVTIIDDKKDHFEYINNNGIKNKYSINEIASNTDSFISFFEYEYERKYSTTQDPINVKKLLIGKWQYINSIRTNDSIIIQTMPEKYEFFENGKFIKYLNGEKITGNWEYKKVSKYYLNLYYDKKQYFITDKNTLKTMDKASKIHMYYKDEGLQIHDISTNTLSFIKIIHIDKNFDQNNQYLRIVYNNYIKY